MYIYINKLGRQLSFGSTVHKSPVQNYRNFPQPKQSDCNQPIYHHCSCSIFANDRQIKK